MKTKKKITYSPDNFAVNSLVNVTVDHSDILVENFTGRVVGIKHIGHAFFVQVQPYCSEEVWDFRPDQIKPCTDEIMHEN